MLTSFCGIRRNTTHAGHTQSMHHRQMKPGLQQRNRKETLTWKLPLRPWRGKRLGLEETDVQEILLAYNESRQLRGEQRVNRGYKPVTRHTSGRKTHRVEGRLNIKELISRTPCRICREKGHWARECPNKKTGVKR